MRPVPIVSALLALLVILAACASPAPTTGAPRVEGESSELTAIERADGARLTVMATTTIVADVVASVAGEMAEVASLLPIGADPHAFTPAPRDMAMLRDADIIMANGAGLEEFLEAYISSAGEGGPRRSSSRSCAGVAPGANVEPRASPDLRKSRPMRATKRASNSATGRDTRAPRWMSQNQSPREAATKVSPAKRPGLAAPERALAP